MRSAWESCPDIYGKNSERKCADGGSMCQHETGYHVIPYAVHEAKQKCNRWAGHVGEHTYIPGADTVPCGESLSETPGEGSEPLKADQWASVPSEAEELQRRVAQIAFDVVVSRTRANPVGRRNGVDMVDVRIPNNEWNKLVDAVVEWENA